MNRQTNMNEARLTEENAEMRRMLKRIASVLSDYGGMQTLFSLKEEDLNFEEKALAHIYEILHGDVRQ